MLKEIKIRNGVRYQLNKFLRKKGADYLGLDRVENLMVGEKDCLVHLCEMLFAAGKKNEAKGICVR